MPPQTVDADLAAKQLDRILGFFPRVESKASFLFAVDTALLGALAVNLQKHDLQVWYQVACVGLSAVLIALSFYCVYRCIFPSLGGGHASLVYFREIARMREAEYLNAMKALQPQQLIDDCLSQVWRNSEILTEKFDWAKRSFVLTGFALVPWSISLVLIALNHPTLPVFK